VAKQTNATLAETGRFDLLWRNLDLDMVVLTAYFLALTSDLIHFKIIISL